MKRPHPGLFMVAVGVVAGQGLKAMLVDLHRKNRQQRQATFLRPLPWLRLPLNAFPDQSGIRREAAGSVAARHGKATT